MNGLKGLVNSFSGYKVLFDMLNMEPNNILIKIDYDRRNRTISMEVDVATTSGEIVNVEVSF